jgi:peptidoglycan hydrolase-like protein with peptidoglycan-binding domain
MAYDAEKVMRIVKGEQGTTEGPNNDNKYGKELGQNKVLWCSLFVSSVMKKAGFGSLYPVTASTRTSHAFYQGKGWIIPKADARSGDIVWFYFCCRSKVVNHVGFVTKNLGNGRLATIEGNSNGPKGVDGVWPHTYKGSIVAVGRPGGRGAVDGPGLAPFPGKVLKRNASGASVEQVQRCLNRFLKQDIPVTGRFDAATEAALIKWQRNRLFPAAIIGRVGPGTWAMLHAPMFSETLKEGSKGKAVQQLKQALNRFGNDLDTNNPNFGPDTKQVVKNWQKHRGQRVDGVVDMRTWYWMHAPENIKPPNLHPGS